MKAIGSSQGRVWQGSCPPHQPKALSTSDLKGQVDKESRCLICYATSQHSTLGAICKA